MVTIILSCVQLISMIVTAVTTDRLGRRPLTVYPYGVTTISVLCLGIVGCFNYSSKSLSSLLVCVISMLDCKWCTKWRLTQVDFLRLLSDLFNNGSFRYWLCICH